MEHQEKLYRIVKGQLVVAPAKAMVNGQLVELDDAMRRKMGCLPLVEGDATPAVPDDGSTLKTTYEYVTEDVMPAAAATNAALRKAIEAGKVKLAKRRVAIRPVYEVLPPPPPPEPAPAPYVPTVADYDGAMESHLYEERVARGYTTREPDAYLTSSNPRWAQDARDWVAHRDAVMEYALGVMHAVEAGEREAPAMEEFRAGLPCIKWTYQESEVSSQEVA